MILKDFQCRTCAKIFEEIVEPGDKPPCSCGGETDTIYIKIAKPVGCDSFSPHYDIQLGQYFGSKEERRSFLERTNRQSDGAESPKKSTKTRILCSRDQAKKLDSATNLKPGEI